MVLDVQLAEPASKVYAEQACATNDGKGEGRSVCIAYVRITGNQYHLSKYITLLINKYYIIVGP
jgi:hypothetical protein